MATDTVLYALADRRGDDHAERPGHAQRAVRRAAAGPDRGLRARPRRRARCAAWCSRPRTRRCSPPAPTSAASRATCRSCTSTSAPSASSTLFRLIGALGKPTVCAARGHVLAGALGIALACDLIVASEKATFGTPEINVGAFPFMIMALIYRNVPRKKANELLLLGERWSAQEALAAGIVNKVVPVEELRRGGRRWAEQARRQVAGDHAPRQGGDAPPAGHAVRRRARLPARAAHAGALHRGHRRGRHRVLREARARSGKAADEQPPEHDRAETSLLRPLVEDLEARRAKIRLGGGEEKIAEAARARKAHRARADRAADRRRHVHRARHPRHARTSPSARWTASTRPPTA